MITEETDKNIRTKKQEYGHAYYLLHKEEILKDSRERSVKYAEKRRLINQANRAKRSEYKKIYSKTDAGKMSAKNSSLKGLYGICLEDFNNMMKAQNYTCAICPAKLKGDKFTHVDHDHKTGKVRGLLCHDCNTGIGNLKEDVLIMNSAIQYLTRCNKIGDDNHG